MDSAQADQLIARIVQLEQRLTALAAAVPQGVDKWSAIGAHLDAVVKQAEDSQRKADDEALRAFNAKNACEEHAKFTTATRGQVEVELAAISAAKTKSEEAQRDIVQIRTGADEASKTISDARTIVLEAKAWIEQNRPVAVEQLQAITVAKTSVDDALRLSRESLERTKTAATETTEKSTQAASHLEQVRLASTQGEELARKTREAKAAAEADASTAGKLAIEVKALRDDLQKSHTDMLAHSQHLESATEDFRKLNEKVEGLLPHAASAGLASAFREQRTRFKSPQKWWLVAFVAAVVLLFALAIPEFWREIFSARQGAPENLSWDTVLRQVLHRLPLAVPLVWLAIYAGRNYSMALRMEEDYAYKEAVSTAFEGYKREMGTIPSNIGSGAAPLVTLCENILNAIAQRPGRIYEGQHQDVTPLTPMVNAAEKLAAARAKVSSPTS